MINMINRMFNNLVYVYKRMWAVAAKPLLVDD